MSDYDPSEMVNLLIAQNNIGEPTSRTVKLAQAVEIVANLPDVLRLSAYIIRNDKPAITDSGLMDRLHLKFTGCDP